MFKQLRNKFLILNLVIISVMMIFAFSTIFLITYKDVYKNIDIELHKISDFDKRPKENLKEFQAKINNDQPPEERSISFVLITDKDGNIINSTSIFEMDKEFLETAKNTALSKNIDSGKFKLGGNYWAYLLTSNDSGNKITFLDITSRQDILINLIYTFLVVAFVMLIVIFFISRYFANKAIHPIKEAFDKQTQFIADASHELKTPLAVISTNVDLVLSNNNATIESQSKWLNYIKSEVERMSKLTNDLLYLTKINYSDIKMIFTNFSLSETVENVILTMEAVIFENNINLEYDIDPSLTVTGNNEQIKQVVMILLDNALKYTNTKGKVNISLKKCHNKIILSVSNTGKGIPKENIDKIFDRFYCVDKSRSRGSGGYGLGLAIAKAILEQHGGSISVSSTLNESTTFMVELPIAIQ